ncbi:MAG TPA: Plug domain-containing protein, partial [Gemmatimonadaceae bacterium]
RAAADTARSDTTRAPADTSARPAVPLPADTLSDTTKVPKDTIKAPLAHSERPPLTGSIIEYHWDRDSIFASGALTLGDLLGRIPGVTQLRSGWLGSPEFASYMGNAARVRIFYDGVELDPLDPRNGGVPDMTDVPLWSLEDIAVERGASELRVYLRSWSITHTATNTRVDVMTGDQGTNLYHAFYGKRFGNGLALQLGGQQYGTSENTTLGGGSDLALMGRLGWAKGRWSLDAFATRSSRTRDEQDPLRAVSSGVPRQERTRTDAYVRGGYGDADSTGGWAQLMVVSQKFDEHTPFRTEALPFAPPDGADTTRSGTQYVATVGFNRGRLRLSAAERYHMLDSGNVNAISGRITYAHPILSLSLYAEYRGPDTSSVEEATARFTPLDFLAISGTAARRHGGPDGTDAVDLRGEVGARVGGLWLAGGVMRRGEETLPALVAFDASYAPVHENALTGIYGNARGKIYKDLGVDVTGIRWNSSGFYRPQMQSREELYLQTDWIGRFPSGDFGFLGSIAHEYRQTTYFPSATPGGGETTTTVAAFNSNVLVTRIEVRIQNAVLFWNATFGISPPIYEYVPGLLQPRQRQLYGVRWQFWN